MALQALGMYAEKAYSPHFDVTIKAKSGSDNHQFSINPANAVVLQSYEVWRCFFISQGLYITQKYSLFLAFVDLLLINDCV
jgi:hypothetical protein